MNSNAVIPPERASQIIQRLRADARRSEGLLAVSFDADKRMILLLERKNFALNGGENIYSRSLRKLELNILPQLCLLGDPSRNTDPRLLKNSGLDSLLLNHIERPRALPGQHRGHLVVIE